LPVSRGIVAYDAPHIVASPFRDFEDVDMSFRAADEESAARCLEIDIGGKDADRRGEKATALLYRTITERLDELADLDKSHADIGTIRHVRAVPRCRPDGMMYACVVQADPFEWNAKPDDQ
jgi:hypothetical protein